MLAVAASMSAVVAVPDVVRAPPHKRHHRLCVVCLDYGRWKVCAGCRGPWYCGIACQKADWPRHKHECCAQVARKQLLACSYMTEEIIDEIRLFVG